MQLVPTQASALKINDYMCINNRPCKIIDRKESKTGKHGGKKLHYFVVDIFTDQKYEFLEMSTKNINAPQVSKNEYQLVDIKNDVVSYFNDKNEIQHDLFLPDLCEDDAKLCQEIKNKFDIDQEQYIIVISAMDIRAIKGFRINANTK